MSQELLELKKNFLKSNKPAFMIAGFNQWANAGNVSSGITEYLIRKLKAKRIGHIHKGNFYFFQLPLTHYLFRPAVKFVEGIEEDYQEEPVNDFYYANVGEKALIIFNGTEPNQHEDVYANTLLDAVSELKIKRIILPAGVGMEVPFDKERIVSCCFSLANLQEELRNYAVIFSNYDKNATIDMVINHYAKTRSIESVIFTARSPSYQVSLEVPTDKRAIYDILRRMRHMFDIELELSDLEKEIKQQISDFEYLIKKACIEDPEVSPQLTSYMEQIRSGFQELSFKEPTKIPDVFLKGFDTPD